MTHKSNVRGSYILGGMLLAACFGLTGCMAEYNGQNLPTPYYQNAQIQYYPAGPEFKLTREAALQKEYRETEAQRIGTPVPVPIPPPPAPAPVQ
jgi:hypothetical protein